MVSKKKIILYAISLSIFLIYILMLLLHYSEIPEIAASHLDIKGKVNGYSSKSSLWISSGVNLLILAVMGLLIKKPEYANYPFEITDKNRENAYKKMQLFLAVIAIITTAFFSFMVFKAVGFEKNFLYLILYAVAAPIFAVFYFRGAEK